MLQISLLDSKLVKFTSSELKFLGFFAVGSEVMVEKGKWWCEDLNVEILKTKDAVIVVRYLSDSGLSVMYEGTDGDLTDVIHHCVHTLHFFDVPTDKEATEQLDNVYNVFRDVKVPAPHYIVIGK
jgi:hypothetical protein